MSNCPRPGETCYEFMCGSSVDGVCKESNVKFKKMTLTKEDIMDVRNEAARAAHEATGYIPGCFEPKALDEASVDLVEQLKEAIRKKELIYRENTELCVICDMALLYLEEHTKEGKND